MKVCKYCGALNENDAKQCRSCRANDFQNKCDQCGTVFESAFCPNCGAKCGARETIQSPQSSVLEHRVVIEQEAPKPAPKKHTFGKILLWILFLPIMGIIAIWKSSKISKLWKIILTCAIVLITIIIYATTPSSESTGAVESSSNIAPTATVQAKVASKQSTAEPAATTEPLRETAKATSAPADVPSATTGETNALAKAYQYLKFTAFSYSGLIGQLEYEGFSTSEATYAANSCGANWKEQAALKAKQYLRYTAFSYSGLVEQLEYEGFSTSEATYAVEQCNANWNEQAALKAEQYLEYSSFSRSGLIDQLEYEGFTAEQAIYGVEQNGY